MFKPLTASISFVLLLTALTACEQSNTSTTDNPLEEISQSDKLDSTTLVSDSGFTITDFANNTLTFTQPAQRIVVLAPHIVENLYAVGAGDKIVGVVAHSDFPKEANNHPIVGGYEKTNYEKIVELQPDLIVAWQSGNSLSNINKLRELGFKVLIDQPDSISDIAKSLRMLGKATGNNELADKAANAFMSKIDSIRAAQVNKRTVSVFYQVWNEPLFTINGNHIISDAIRVCGGRNVFADEVAVAPRTNVESVIASNPEAIIASGMGEARPEWLDDWKQWRSIDAVKNNHLFYVNPDHLQRHTIRQLLAIESICQQLDQVRTLPQ